MADLPGFGTNWGSFSELGMLQYEERVHNAYIGFGFNTNEQLGGIPGTRLTPIYGELNPGEGTGMSPDGTTISVNTNWGIIGYEWASDDDWWSSSQWQTQEFDRRRVTTDEGAILKSEMTKAAGDKDSFCRKYVTDVLNQALKNAGLSASALIANSLEDMFDIVLNSRAGVKGEYGGVFISQSGNKSAYGGNNWHWVNIPNAQIQLPYGNNDRTVSEVMAGIRDPGMTIIHELMHIAIRGMDRRDSDDFAMARAVADVAGVARPVFDLTDDTSGGKASEWWGDRLRQACGFSSRQGPFTTHQLYKPSN